MSHEFVYVNVWQQPTICFYIIVSPEFLFGRNSQLSHPYVISKFVKFGIGNLAKHWILLPGPGWLLSS